MTKRGETGKTFRIPKRSQSDHKKKEESLRMQYQFLQQTHITIEQWHP